MGCWENGPRNSVRSYNNLDSKLMSWKLYTSLAIETNVKNISVVRDKEKNMTWLSWVS